MAIRHDESLAAVERCPLAGLEIDLAQVDRLSPALLRRHRILPHALQDGVLQVTTAQVADPVLADELAFVTGLTARTRVATGGDLDEVIEAALAALRRGEAHLTWTGSPEPEIGSDLVSLGNLPAVGPAARAGATRGPAPESEAEAPISLPAVPAAALRAVAVAAAAPAATPAPEPRPGPASGLTATVLEPAPGTLDRVRNELAAVGFRVTLAPATPDAFLGLERHPTDVVLVTDRVPGETHVFDHCAELRRQLGPDRGVILLARAAGEDWRLAADLAREVGIDACLGLPVDGRALLRALERALRARLGRTLALVPRPDPAEPESWLAKGIERYRRGEVAPAIEAFERGLARDPDHVGLLGSLAVAQARQGQMLLAMDALERALCVDPGQVPVLRNLAQIYERRGFRHKAIETWHRALLVTMEPERRQEILTHLEELWRA